MSAAKSVPTVMRALALIRYSELVADLLAGVIRADRMRQRGDKEYPTFVRRLAELLTETTVYRRDYGLDIQGLDFEKVRGRVLEVIERAKL